MPISVAVQTALTYDLPTLSEIIYRDISPMIAETSLSWSEVPKVFGEGGAIPLATKGITDGGFVRNYQLLVGDNARVLGQADKDTEVPDVETAPSWTTLRVTPNHIEDIEVSHVISDRVLKLIKHNPAKAAMQLENLAIHTSEQAARRTDCLLIANRQGILGKLEGAPSWSDNTARSCYTSTIALDATSIPIAFEKSAALQFAAPPASAHAAVTTLRNYSFPIRVIGRYQLYFNGTSYIRVLVAAPYTAATKVAVAAQLATIDDNDVIGPWAGATSGTTDLPRGGFNYGLCGLRHYLESDETVERMDTGSFANIETCGGGVTHPLLTYDPDTSPTTISRNDPEYDFLRPLAYCAGGTAFDFEEHLDPLFGDLHTKRGKKQNRRILANRLMHAWMRKLVGLASITATERADDATRRRALMHGASTISYQGESDTPIEVEQLNALPCDMVPLMTSGVFEILRIGSPGFKEGSLGGVWSERRNSSGKILHSKQTTWEDSIQLFPAEDQTLQDIAVVRYTRPGVDADL